MSSERPHIPFNRAPATGLEAGFIAEAIAHAHLSADGEFSDLCGRWLEEKTGSPSSLLVHSCTAALEMSALLLEIGPGDEVIMPSYTFVSTANAFVLRGATPVFVDVVSGTFNLDPERVEAAIGPATKVIVPVHYAGVGCEMDALCDLGADAGVTVVEDAAQGLMATYRGKPLGSMGELAAISFHETKNVTCGEGGALLVNDDSLLERAEILREKGTDRSKFFRGQVDKYTWVDIGSSHALSDLAAAFLWAQLQEAEAITASRMAIWDTYHRELEVLERHGVQRPQVPEHCVHNAHMYFLVLPDSVPRDEFIGAMRAEDIHPVFHYVPLHSSPAGQRVGRVAGELPNTDRAGSHLVRLPLWPAMTDSEVERVIEQTIRTIGELDGAGSPLSGQQIPGPVDLDLPVAESRHGQAP